jgi:hypothetical protein
MPGTLVSDASAPELLDGSNVTATGQGSAVEVGYLGHVRAMLALGTCTGTTTSLDLKVQGSDDSGFSSGVVDYGEFPTKDQDDDSTTSFLDIVVQHRYVRANYVVAGTSPVFPATLTLEESEYLRTPTDSA